MGDLRRGCRRGPGEKAFQQVLDTPGAEKALEDPALKPLLDLAAD